MRLIDIDNIVLMYGRGNGKTIVIDTVKKILESLPTVEAIPIDWIEEFCLSQDLEYVRIAIKKMMDNWKEERKGEKKTMTKIITFYELLTMLNDGTAPRKIYVQAEGKKHYYVRNGRDYTACNGSDTLLKLMIKYRTSTQWLVDFKFIHYEESVLDEVEKKYLETVLRPFKNRFKTIEKVETGNSDNNCFLKLESDDDIMVFPYFKKGEMYKGMDGNKRYTLKELGLWENTK